MEVSRSILTFPSRLRLHSGWSFTFHYARQKDSSNPCPDHTTVSRRNRTVTVCRCPGGLPNGPVLLMSPMDTNMIRLRCLAFWPKLTEKLTDSWGDRIYDQEAVYEAVDHHSPATKPHGTKVSRHFGAKPTI